MTCIDHISYRGYVIHPNPCNVDARCDWLYAHDDYDGAPDAGDTRCGFAASIEACKAEIDAAEDEA